MSKFIRMIDPYKMEHSDVITHVRGRGGEKYVCNIKTPLCVRVDHFQIRSIENGCIEFSTKNKVHRKINVVCGVFDEIEKCVLDVIEKHKSEWCDGRNVSRYQLAMAYRTPLRARPQETVISCTYGGDVARDAAQHATWMREKRFVSFVVEYTGFELYDADIVPLFRLKTLQDSRATQFTQSLQITRRSGESDSDVSDSEMNFLPSDIECGKRTRIFAPYEANDCNNTEAVPAREHTHINTTDEIVDTRTNDCNATGVAEHLDCNATGVAEHLDCNATGVAEHLDGDATGGAEHLAGDVSQDIPHDVHAMHVISENSLDELRDVQDTLLAEIECPDGVVAAMNDYCVTTQSVCETGSVMSSMSMGRDVCASADASCGGRTRDTEQGARRTSKRAPLARDVRSKSDMYDYSVESAGSERGAHKKAERLKSSLYITNKKYETILKRGGQERSSSGSDTRAAHRNNA